MKKTFILSTVVCLCISSVSSADTFGTGANQFQIDFVTISGDASSANGTPIGSPKTFSDPGRDFRIAKFEITNDQWDKFKSQLGVPVIGNPSYAYDTNPAWTGTNVPANCISWYEAAQFVNWLNTSNDYQAAYKFTGTQGTSSYAFAVWNTTDDGYNPDNPYRNSNAVYFLPTEDEWVKAAYWNGTNLQRYSNASASDLISGSPDTSKWNTQFSDGSEPWDVGSGAKELNGTYDMMGNVYEWTESPYFAGNFSGDLYWLRVRRGGSYYSVGWEGSTVRAGSEPRLDEFNLGFRVASVPEPTSAILLIVGAGLLRVGKRKR